ncbi:MAG: hypothetical protein V4479_04735 [Actinomycetota bacterium]
MTLTTILPSLRRSIPDPLDPDQWPEGTVATTTDLIVAGLSLTHVAEVSGTPCSVSGCSVAPGTHGRPSTTHHTSVTLVTVTSCDVGPAGELSIGVDGGPDCATQIWPAARLVGRASVCHVRPVAFGLPAGPGRVGLTVLLPGDIRVGDLLAIPSRPIRVAATGDGPGWLEDLE